MVLTRLQRRRFCALLDKLTLYANARLGVMAEGELRSGEDGAIDEQAQLRVARKLWQEPALIGDYVRENPDGLSTGELAVVESWRGGLSGVFVADVFPDGAVRFIGGGCAFNVFGISQEPASMLGYRLPRAVQTTLLPFDGHIVFAGGFTVLPLEFDDDQMRKIEENIDDICENETFVHTADALLAMSSFIREKGLIADGAEFMDKLEEAMANARYEKEKTAPGVTRSWAADPYDSPDRDGEPAPEDLVQHRGCLAGMAHGEREEAVRDYMNRDDLLLDGLRDILDESCLEGPIERGLAALLARDDAYLVGKLARSIGVPDVFELKGEALTAAVVEHFADDDAMQGALDELPEHEVLALRELAARGGIWEVPEDELTSLRELPARRAGLCYVFHENGQFTFVMPDEMLGLSRTLDWEGVLANARRYRELVSFADKVVELRGMAPFEDFCEEYRANADDPYETNGEALDRLVQAVGEQVGVFSLFQEEEGELFLLHYVLLDAYDEERGEEHSPYLVEPIAKGKLDGVLGALRTRQGSKKPRPLTPEMLATRTLLEWRYAQDSAQAFVRYLDERVPAAEDDFYFADSVTEALLDSVSPGLDGNATDALFDTLEDHFFIPEPDQVQELLDLWSELVEAQPAWAHNGWSVRELADLEAR